MSAPRNDRTLYEPIRTNVEDYIRSFDKIPDSRKESLATLASFIARKVRAGETARLVFICTHNSRRSHIAQIWAQAAAYHYHIPNVATFSGGTEATAFNPRAVSAMQRAGFRIVGRAGETNPFYDVTFAGDASPMNIFSKRYDETPNPSSDFAAVMTCSHADQHCPAMPGAAVRIALPYDDPKNFDDTLQETSMYTGRVHEIGREMVYALSRVAAIE